MLLDNLYAKSFPVSIVSKLLPIVVITHNAPVGVTQRDGARCKSTADPIPPDPMKGGDEEEESVKKSFYCMRV